jgi:precorrin-6Y C5,15-methyltransferase (decarboxylating)
MTQAPANPATVAPWLSVVGLGEAGWDELSPGAQQAVRGAQLVIGGERHLALIPAATDSASGDQEHRVWPSPLHEALPAIVARRGTPVCVLATGDPFWHGVGVTLARHIDPAEMRVWPGLSAYALAAARMGWALQATACVSVHGRALERLIPRLHDGARLLLLSWDGSTPQAVAERLSARGFGDSKITALGHMGGPDEARWAGTAEDWPHGHVADLNTVAVDCVAAADARPMAQVPGRPEEAFDHDGQITKREVRAVTLAHLAPGRMERLWDVGAGSGAIAIEWMLSDPSNQAWAVEAQPARAARIRANAAASGVPDLVCVEGEAPQALEDLAAPDAVFIGGGLTGADVVARCWQALRPGGRLVANSVTVDGDGVLTAARGEYGGELVRIAIDRAEPLGRYTGWTPQRPVTLWAARKPAAPADTNEEATP